MKFRRFALAALLSASSVASFASPVSLSQTQTATVNGEDLAFVFSSLLASNGAGGVVTFRPTGGTTTGLDLSGAFPSESENFEVAFDGVSQGFFSCGGPSNNGSTPIAGATDNSGNFNDCVFTLPLSLADSFLADGSLSVDVRFGGDVSFVGRGDQLNVVLSYDSAAVAVPEPGSLALVALAMLSAGVSRRRVAGR